MHPLASGPHCFKSQIDDHDVFNSQIRFARLGRCPSTVLRVALGRALIYEGNETVLGTNPNRTHDQPKLYLETAETVLDLYSDKGMFPFLLRGAHKKNSLKIDAFPVSNRTRNRTRTAAERFSRNSRGPKTHPKSRNTKKTPHLHELFRKVRPNRNCSEKLVQKNFWFWGGFFRVDFPPLKV